MNDSHAAALEAALETLSQTVAQWDPDNGPEVTPILAALKELHLCFDPRKDRLSASLCVTSMKLLEQIQEHGSVGSVAAVGAVGELALGLQESLSAETAVATHSSAARPFVTLQSSGQSSGLSLALALDNVDDQPLSEVMIKMGMLTAEQAEHVRAVRDEGETTKLFGELAVELGYVSQTTVDTALRLQQRGRGEVPEAREPDDAWGSSPL
jgi:hypothetical protein